MCCCLEVTIVFLVILNTLELSNSSIMKFLIVILHFVNTCVFLYYFATITQHYLRYEISTKVILDSSLDNLPFVSICTKPSNSKYANMTVRYYNVEFDREVIFYKGK